MGLFSKKKSQPPPELSPPVAGQSLLRSYSSAEIIDLLCEGPIYGIVDASGYKLEPSNYGKGVYFNDYPVQNTGGFYNYQKTTIDFYHGAERYGSGIGDDFGYPQEPISSKSYRDSAVGKVIYGPFNRANGAIEGTGSVDFRNGKNFSTWADNGNLSEEAVGYTFQVTDSFVDSAILNFKITKLSDTQDIGQGIVGTARETLITVSITVGYDGDSASNAVTTEHTIRGLVQNGYEFSQKVTLPIADTRDRYITVNRVTPETISPLIFREIALSSVTEVISDQFAFPFSSVIKTSFDSRYFAEIPQRSFDCKLKLIKVPSNYFPTKETIGATDRGRDYRVLSAAQVAAGTQGEQIYKGDWDGTFKMAWSDNPAWIVYDILTNNVYGLADNIESDTVDKWTMYDIGRYCDAVDDDGYFVGVDDGNGNREPRFVCNLLMTEQKDAFETVTYLCSVFRGMAYWFNGGISFASDRPRESVFTIANSDVLNGMFTYTEAARNSRFTAVEVTYNDKNDNFIPKIEYVEDPDLLQKYGLIKSENQGLGFTSRSQARRFAKYLLLTSKFEAEVVDFSMAYQALYLRPGDVIKINDELRSFCKNYGKLFAKEENIGKLTLDSDLPTDRVSGDGVLSGNITLIYPQDNTDASDLDYMLNPTGTNEFATSPSLFDIRNFRRPQSVDFFFTGSGNFVYVNDVSGILSSVPDHSTYIVSVNGYNPSSFRVLSVKEEKDSQFRVTASTFFEDKFSGADFDVFIGDTFDDSDSIASVILPPDAPTSLTITLDTVGDPEVQTVKTVTVKFTAVAPRSASESISYRITLTLPNGQNQVFTKSGGNPATTGYSLGDFSVIGTYLVSVQTVAENSESGETSLSLSSSDETFSLALPDVPTFAFSSVTVRNGFQGNSFYEVSGQSGLGYWDSLPFVIDFSLSSEATSFGDNQVNSSPYIVDNEVTIFASGTGSQISYTTNDNSFTFDSAKMAQLGSSRNLKFTISGKNNETPNQTFSSIFYAQNPEPSLAVYSVTNPHGANPYADGDTGILTFGLTGSAYSQYLGVDVFTGSVADASNRAYLETFIPQFDENRNLQYTVNNDSLRTGSQYYFWFKARDGFGSGSYSAITTGTYYEQFGEIQTQQYIFTEATGISMSFGQTGNYTINFDRKIFDGVPSFSFQPSGDSENYMGDLSIYTTALGTGAIDFQVRLNVFSGAGERGGTLYLTVIGEEEI